MKRLLFRLWEEEDGAAMVEYALLVAFVALVTYPAVNAIRGALQSAYVRWNSVETNFWQVPPCDACS